MTREDILSKLKTIIDTQLACGEDAVTEDETLEALGADSFDKMEIVIASEEEFSIDIDDDKAEEVKTVAQVIDLISNELA